MHGFEVQKEKTHLLPAAHNVGRTLLLPTWLAGTRKAGSLGETNFVGNKNELVFLRLTTRLLTD